MGDGEKFTPEESRLNFLTILGTIVISVSKEYSMNVLRDQNPFAAHSAHANRRSSWQSKMLYSFAPCTKTSQRTLRVCGTAFHQRTCIIQCGSSCSGLIHSFRLHMPLRRYELQNKFFLLYKKLLYFFRFTWYRKSESIAWRIRIKIPGHIHRKWCFP